MLSYMLPVEEKTSPPRNLNLNLNLNSGASVGAVATMGSANMNGNNAETCDENTKLLSSERAHILKNSATRELKLDNNVKPIQQQQQNGDNGDTTVAISGTEDVSSGCEDSKSISKKGKLSKIGTKNVTLKRVSFGSSKGSMVETLVFETPTPLPEHCDRKFGFLPETSATPLTYGSKIFNNNNNNHNNNNNSSCLDDSGIEMQEESERSKVRVTFFQSSKPQQVSPPDSYITFTDCNFPLLSDTYIPEGSILSEDTMTAATATQPTYDRQLSTESGWDNPFRPGGDLSREADEIVNMIKGGKPITPTGDASHSIANGNAQKDSGNHIENGTTVVDGATKAEVSHVQSTPAQNGTKSPQQKTTGKANGDTKSSAPQTQVSNQVIPGPISASHVVIEDKKKKKCTCCVIQ